MNKIIAIAAIATLLVSCNVNNTKLALNPNSQNQSIIGGDKVSTGDSQYFPVVALVMVNKTTKDYQGLCTATVITDGTLLTAAHCVVDLPANVELFAFFGTDIKNEKSIRMIRKIDKTVYHESYNPGKMDATYDIALASFSGGLPADIKPVLLSADVSQVRINQPIVITGFGVSGKILGTGSGKLRTNTVKITDPNFSPIEFGVGQFSDGVCSGDSGGPAFVVDNEGNFVQVGIVSRGFDFKVIKCIVNSYFTRVDVMIDWITTENQKLHQD